MSEPRLNRIVVGPDAQGRSAVLIDDVTNVQEKEGFFWRSTLWSAAGIPVDNSIEGDLGMATSNREPFPGGLLVRALEIPPDVDDAEEHKRVLAQLNTEINQKIVASEADLKRHPSMHATNTLDAITCVRGEIYLVTDVEEVLMKPGDTVIIRGTNHAWSNRSSAPCLLVGTMIDAVPQPRAH
jgi:quercetin dioxygenase-like cupin family protein